MPRKKIVRKRKMKTDPLADLLSRGNAIRESFASRQPQLRKQMLSEYTGWVKHWAKKFNLPEPVIRDWLKRRDGSTLPELAAKYREATPEAL